MSANERNEFWACLALRHTRGIGPRTWKRFFDAYGSAYDAVMDSAGWAGRHLASCAQIEAYRSEAWRINAKHEWDQVLGKGYAPLLWTDSRYPAWLREIPDPPLFLYYAGDLTLLANPCVALVGTRKSTSYGREATREIGEGLSAAGVTVVSGMAYGIDRQAHLAGLKYVGSSIAVLGAGLDVDYPVGNHDVRALLLEKGLIITELMPGASPEPRNFPVRNRIISGLSLAVVVMEASLPSGSMITARLALEQGREVFAVPGARDASMHAGCFELINQGAKLVCSANDILRELAALLAVKSDAPRPELRAVEPASSAPPRRSSAPQAPVLSAEENRVIRALRDAQRLHIDALGNALGCEPGKLSRLLILLEMRGLVQQWPGMIYSAT